MRNKKVTPEQSESIELLIAEQLSCGNSDMAASLASSLGRRLSTDEVDGLLEYFMKQQCPEVYLRKMADIAMYGSSKFLYEKVIDIAAEHGELSVMYIMSASCGRKPVQSEIDKVYLHALNDLSPIDFAKSIKYILHFDSMKSFSFNCEPSKGLANKIIRRLIDDNQLAVAENLVWLLFLHEKEQVRQDLIDELVNLMYQNYKGWSFFAISNTSDVIRLASTQVIEKLLDDYLNRSHEPLRLFEFASCDIEGVLTDKVIKILIEDARKLGDDIKKPSYLRSIVQILLNPVYRVVTTFSTATEFTLYLLEEGLWGPSYSMALHFALDKSVADKIVKLLLDIKAERDTDERILSMYRRYGASDDVRDMLIRSFSQNVFYNRNLNESISVVAELGGTTSLDNLILDLLTHARYSFAVDVAKNKLVSASVRESVIERSIIAFSSLDFILPLVKLNKRALRKNEIHTIIRLNIDALKKSQNNIETYAECAIEMLKYKASLELVPDLLFALKERKLTSHYVNVSIDTGVKIE